MTQMLRDYRNGFHRGHEDEYEDDEYDEYEDEGSEGEEEGEQKQEEERKPSKEELEFLKLREERKEMYRQKLKKQSAKDFGHSILSKTSERTLANTKFGSFFGPSQPVIASRVLDESRSIRETQHIISKPPSSSGNERVSVSASQEKKFSEHHHRPKVNEVKRKVQTLKDSRDYSFLLSDDADLPDNKAPQTTTRHVSAPMTDARSTQAALKTKIPTSKPLKSTSNGHDMKNAVQVSRPMQTKVPMKGFHVSRPPPSSSEPRKIPVSKVGGNGHNRPVGPKPLAAPSKVSVQSKVPVEVIGTNKPGSKSMNGLILKKNISTAKPHSSTQNHYAEQKRPSQAADRVRAAPKPAAPRLTPPSLKSQPPKPISSQNIRDESQKKKPVRRRPDGDDEDDAIQMIRNMFRYNPSKYADMDDDDDSDMEADFSQIEREERRSSQIARREDEEQLLLIEEEERRERTRKKLKSTKR
ncbi:protein SPT2 homolog [Phalaenopsis equestris]|uniref:protein SPT2 homolog n=1 Tax=Phalaenopsis equestris TaxID=78828 RepID=UPI0009E62452|nr:protein SPT2 homolog [Phalaenopsis equestris]